MRIYQSRSTSHSTPSLVLSICLLFVGVSIILPQPAVPSDTLIAPTDLIYSSRPPTRIEIDSINIDLPISISPIVHGYWQVSPNTASYGVGSGEIGKPGNAVIFAHSKYGQFLALKKIAIGANISITTSEKTYTYTVISIKKVIPTDLSVIAPTTDQVLTLYTCDGLNDSKRLVVQAAAAGN